MLERRSSFTRLSPWLRFGMSAGLSAGLGMAAPHDAHAQSGSDDVPAPRKKHIPYKALEVQGVIVGQLLPKPGFGVDGAIVLGTETFQFRFGGVLLGTPAFKHGEGKIANVLGALTGDICVARNVYRNQIRMCMGGQGGGMVHQWIGYDRPGRRLTAWWAGTLKGDYRYAVTERFGVIGGVGVVVPVMGPAFHARSQSGGQVPVVFPGPVGGQVNVGTSLRF